jgi:hypothetical protein
MAVTVRELEEWLRNFDPDTEVGIDEGGLTLCVVQKLDAYYEIGGLPLIYDDWSPEQ